MPVLIRDVLYHHKSSYACMLKIVFEKLLVKIISVLEKLSQEGFLFTFARHPGVLKSWASGY